MDTLTYARAGGRQGPGDEGEPLSPVHWSNLDVINLETEQPVDMVVEVNTEEGWLVRFADRVDGRLRIDPDTNEPVMLHENGRFELRVRG